MFWTNQSSNTMVGKFGEFRHVNWTFWLNFCNIKEETQLHSHLLICGAVFQYEVYERFMGQSCHCSCFPPLLCSAPGATDRCGDLLHDEKVQVQANDPDPGEAVQVWVHHCGHLPRGRHPQRARGQMASVWLPHLLPLQGCNTHTQTHTKWQYPHCDFFISYI